MDTELDVGIGRVLSSQLTPLGVHFRIEVRGDVLPYLCAVNADKDVVRRIGMHQLKELVLACGLERIADSDELNGKRMIVWTKPAKELGSIIRVLRPIPDPFAKPEFLPLRERVPTSYPKTLWDRIVGRIWS